MKYTLVSQFYVRITKNHLRSEPIRDENRAIVVRCHSQWATSRRRSQINAALTPHYRRTVLSSRLPNGAHCGAPISQMENGIPISSFLIYLQSVKTKKTLEDIFLHSHFCDAFFYLQPKQSKLLTCFFGNFYKENFVCVLEKRFPFKKPMSYELRFESTVLILSHPKKYLVLQKEFYYKYIRDGNWLRSSFYTHSYITKWVVEH